MTLHSGAIINSPPARLRDLLGYRGLTLLLFGSMFTIIGLGVAVDPMEPVATLPHTLLPVWFRVVLWASGGLAGVTAGVLSIWWPKWQILAFYLLFIPPAERAASYGYAAIVEWPEPHTWSSFALLLVGLGLAVLAGLAGRRRSGRWPMRVALWSVAAVGVTIFGLLASWSLDQLPWPRITGSLLYSMLAAGLLLFASWPEPTKAVSPVVRGVA